MRARYYISFNATDYTEIFLSNTPTVKPAQVAGEVFFRNMVDEFVITATKNPTVYTTLDTYFFDKTKFASDINYRIKENGVTTFDFVASISDGEMDTERRVYTVAPEPDDSYRPILAAYKTKYRDTDAVAVINSSKAYNFPIDNGGSFANAAAPNDYTTFSDTLGLVTIYDDTGTGGKARQEITAVTMASGWSVDLYISSKTGTNVTVKLVNQTFTAISASGTISAAGWVHLVWSMGTATTVYVELSNTGLVDTVFEYQLFANDRVSGVGDTLESGINRIMGLNFMNVGLTAKSTYLWNDAVPSDAPASITSYIAANPTKDYVIEGAAIWNDLFINKVGKFTQDDQTDFELSLEDLMTILKTKLRAWWYIDAAGDFRIEHEKYFRSYASQKTIGATPQVDNKRYTYDKGNIFSSILYKENNQFNDDFIAYPIVYDYTITSDKNNDINLGDLSTDISNLYNASGVLSINGIMLSHGVLYTNDFQVRQGVSEFGTDLVINKFLSWSHLFANYWGYFGEGGSADINNGDTLNLTGVKEFLVQEGIRFYSTTALDWKKPVTTAIGTAWLKRWSYVPETGFYSIDVGYDPYTI